MTEKCTWIINLGRDDTPAQKAAAVLAGYGLKPKGQRWPRGETNAWMASAQEAAEQNAAVVILVGSTAELADPATLAELSGFRLALQTHRGGVVNGMSLVQAGADAGVDATAAGAGARTGVDAGTGAVTEARAGAVHAGRSAGTGAAFGVLSDWLAPAENNWAAKAVARAHVPASPRWPVRLSMHAHERLGAWLEVHPMPSETAQGACVGVSGNEAGINFHAVGAAGALPERSVNEYELQGLKFEIGERAFDAWALQNAISPEQSYFVRLDGLPHYLAVGALPDGQLEEVQIISLVS